MGFVSVESRPRIQIPLTKHRCGYSVAAHKSDETADVSSDGAVRISTLDERQCCKFMPLTMPNKKSSSKVRSFKGGNPGNARSSGASNFDLGSSKSDENAADWINAAVKDPLVEIDPVTMERLLKTQPASFVKAGKSAPRQASSATPVAISCEPLWHFFASSPPPKGLGSFLLAFGATVFVASLAAAAHLLRRHRQEIVKLGFFPSIQGKPIVESTSSYDSSQSDEENKLDLLSIVEAGGSSCDEEGGDEKGFKIEVGGASRDVKLQEDYVSVTAPRMASRTAYEPSSSRMSGKEKRLDFEEVTTTSSRDTHSSKNKTEDSRSSKDVDGMDAEIKTFVVAAKKALQGSSADRDMTNLSRTTEAGGDLQDTMEERDGVKMMQMEIRPTTVTPTSTDYEVAEMTGFESSLGHGIYDTETKSANILATGGSRVGDEEQMEMEDVVTPEVVLAAAVAATASISEEFRNVIKERILEERQNYEGDEQDMEDPEATQTDDSSDQSDFEDDKLTDGIVRDVLQDLAALETKEREKAANNYRGSIALESNEDIGDGVTSAPGSIDETANENIQAVDDELITRVSKAGTEERTAVGHGEDNVKESETNETKGIFLADGDKHDHLKVSPYSKHFQEQNGTSSRKGESHQMESFGRCLDQDRNVPMQNEYREEIKKIVQSVVPAVAVGTGALSIITGVEGALEMVGFAATASFVCYDLLWAETRQHLYQEFRNVKDHSELFHFLKSKKIVQPDEL